MADQEQNIKQEYTNSVTGMNMDNVLSQIPKGQVSFCLNGAIESFDSSGISYQNELGNEFCMDFPEGYNLIGKHFIVEQNKHIFFLVNPLSESSEIGYMANNDCIYHTLINAPCLNFDVNYPIHKVVHRITNCSTEIYWTDGHNPRRYMSIDPDNIPMSIQYGTPLCDPAYTNQLDCNQLNIQPNFDIPLLSVREVTNAGNLIAGTYQFAIQYSDDLGNPLTSYYSVTNPTPIADTSISSASFNYPVGKSIILAIENLDITGLFRYVNVAVIKTINAISSVDLIGTYSIEKEDMVITYTGQNIINLAMEDIFEKYPYYEIAQDLTTAQDILIWDQLSSIDRVNYQQIANKITLQWETFVIPATENYADEINAANLRGYLRDEVYPFEIVFLLNNGKQTDGFHIPGRAKNLNEILKADVPETNTDFVGAPTYYSGGVGYSPYWKIYNTASVIGLVPGWNISDDYKGPYQYGEFAYWESTDLYPCNEEVWGDLAGTPIRHHKFPDASVSPIMSDRAFINKYFLEMGNNKVFPIGVKIDVDQIQSLIASSSLTAEQKSEIVGFKIVRGDRSTNKSVVAKGILRNVNTYEREKNQYFYPNYPYNDLRSDPFLNQTNNAYAAECDTFTINITQLYFDPNTQLNVAKVQYIDCNTNKSAEEKYFTTGEHSLCSIGKPSLVFGKGTVSYTNYDEYRLASEGIHNGWKAEYNDITVGIDTVYLNGNLGGGHREVYVKVVVGSVPVCVGWCNRGGKVIEFLGRHITTSPCVSPDPVQPTTDKERQIFNSPETSFGQPFLGDILKLESVIFGSGKAHFKQVKDNARYKLLSKEAQQKALDSSAKLGGITSDFGVEAMFAAYQAYLTIYINGITRKNYAYSFNSIADYNHYALVPNDEGNKQRNIEIAKYLIPAVVSTGDTLDINNWQRESSVYLKTNGELPFPDRSTNMLSGTNSILTEYSRFTISEVGHCNVPEEEEPIQVVSYYGSIKKDFVNQWGQVYSYETIDTGFQCIFSNPPDHSVVFGGDTYISRFAFKTKLPFFIDNRVGAPDDSDIFYDEIGNIAYPKYWHSSRSILDDYSIPQGDSHNSPGILVNFISYKAHNFDCPNDTSFSTTGTTTTVFGTTTTTTTVKQTVGTVTTGDADRTYYDGYFYLFAYGVPYFYCESSYNTDLRQAFNNREGDFWPHVSNSIPDDWVQESFVSIANDNTYHYNTTFSKQNKENYFSHLPADWDGDVCLTHYPFRTIYSDPQSADADNRVNTWRIYRATSYFDFPQNYGPLTSLDGIQNRAILARFHNKTLLYGNLLTLDTSNPQAAYLGNPALFKGTVPIDFADTDLGYAGSQHKLLLKIPHGQISIDAKRGSIFLIQGTEATDISGFGSGMNRFLTDHLNFELQRYFPEVNVDNHFNGVGLHAVYDSKYERVIITKLDYAPLNSDVLYDSAYREFYVLDEYENRTIVSLKDRDYFCNKSWTLCYNMNTKSWISFHSYLPNWYIGENNFFYSGVNGCCDDFDFIAGELPSPFNCELWGVAILEGCSPICTLEAIAEVVCPTTTTTSSTSSTTTTTSTTLYPPCAVEGNAQEICITPSTTTTTTTECIRPEGLTAFNFITGHTLGGVTIDSTTDADLACDEMHWLLNTVAPYTINYIRVEAVSLFDTLYLSDGSRDCECKIPDGWYFTDETASYDYVFHVVGCIVVETFSCATTTTSSTSSTTTTTTTIVYDCTVEGNAQEICPEPTTTTTTSSTSSTTTTTSTTCYLAAHLVEVVCEDVEDCDCETVMTVGEASYEDPMVIIKGYNIIDTEEMPIFGSLSPNCESVLALATMSAEEESLFLAASQLIIPYSESYPSVKVVYVNDFPYYLYCLGVFELESSQFIGYYSADHLPFPDEEETCDIRICNEEVPECFDAILTVGEAPEAYPIGTMGYSNFLINFGELSPAYNIAAIVISTEEELTLLTVVLFNDLSSVCPTLTIEIDETEYGLTLLDVEGFVIYIGGFPENPLPAIGETCTVRICNTQCTTTTTTTEEPTTTTTTTCNPLKCDYGLLYNWYAVNTGKLAPTGWHVPTDAEWTTLTTWLTDNGYGYEGSGDDIAKSMAFTCGWNTYSPPGTPGNDPDTNNSSGFSGLPGGYRGTDGSFSSIGPNGTWWSSTEYSSSSACTRILDYYSSTVTWYDHLKGYGFSVRCLRDNSTDWTPSEKMIDIDGNQYDTIQIGTQIWTIQNLKTTHYNDGESIPNVENYIAWNNLTTGACCVYNNDWDTYACVPEPTTTTTTTVEPTTTTTTTDEMCEYEGIMTVGDSGDGAYGYQKELFGTINPIDNVVEFILYDTNDDPFVLMVALYGCYDIITLYVDDIPYILSFYEAGYSNSYALPLLNNPFPSVGETCNIKICYGTPCSTTTTTTTLP